MAMAALGLPLTAAQCEQLKDPKRPFEIVWKKARWGGVPWPLRRRLRKTHGVEDVDYLPGCGCLVRVKRWWRVIKTVIKRRRFLTRRATGATEDGVNPSAPPGQDGIAGRSSTGCARGLAPPVATACTPLRGSEHRVLASGVTGAEPLSSADPEHQAFLRRAFIGVEAAEAGSAGW